MRCGPGLTWTSCSAWTPGPSASRSRTVPARPRTRPSPRTRADRAHGPGAGRAAGRDDPARVRRPGHLDHPGGHLDRTGRTGPASWAGSGPSTLTWPGTWPAPRPATPVDLVRDRHRQPGARHRPRLRPAASRRRKPDGPDPPGGPRFTFTPADHPGPPGGYGTWRFTTGQQDLLIEIGPLPTGDCDHRWQARGHDPGVMLRHLTEVRHATCTGPGCRRPAGRCDFEHNVPYEAGGRTCLCNGGPKCRFDHRMKQDPRWNAEQLPSGEVRWTAPSGRQYVTEPTRYPI